MVRYAPFEVVLKDNSKHISPDSYLNINYNAPISKKGEISADWQYKINNFGSLDMSDSQSFIKRAGLSGKNTEAEWFMVSDISLGYGKQLAKLLEIYPNNRDNKELKELIKYCLKKEIEYINRGYARITGKNLLKSNGSPCPAFVIPEAYQHVSNLKKDSRGFTGNLATLIPGINTPLIWAVSSLENASNMLLKNLIIYEELGL